MILVTGGGGFLGGHIVDKLLARGEAVRVLGRRDYPRLAERGVECRRVDLADAAGVFAAVQGCDAVIHTAAIPGVWGRYETYYTANFEGARNLVEACLEYGVGRLVYTSTPSVVHGGDGIDGGDESLPYPDHYLTPYAATKALAEKLVLSKNSPAFATVAIRPHLIFGPGDTQLIPKLLARAKTGQLTRVGEGRNLISVSYVENVADAHLAALDRLRPGAALAGRAYFVNEPEPVNCWDFINRIVTGVGLPGVRRAVPYRVAYAAGWLCEKIAALRGQTDDPRLTRFLVTQLGTSHWFRVDAAMRDFGWTPAVPFETGLERMLEDMKERKYGQ
ncbi:MAG: NAD-dependent epimerase/dehydratase family protein [Planctomycetaceae bacterium]|nr:NAD-dependent epimerase/dehydratase family protein [Planctomycetaceae bacterium]